MYDKEIQMLKPVIDESTFTLPFRCGSNISSDIRYGSQSESTLLSLALSLSLASSLTAYNVPLIDEMDAALDAEMRDSFLMMLQEIMSVLKMEQMFIISHSTQPGAYDHAVHVINISEEIANLKE
jgi:DNA repair exonuclease SbcCD ATPase subunit